MAFNKFFTIMIVPEKSNRVTKVVLPSYIFKGALVAIAFLAVLATIMILDYANVMNQINENKQLKTENRQLRQSVQVFKTKVVTIENTLDRVKTFVTKLRIITNIEDSPSSPFTPTNAPAVSPESAPPLPAEVPQGLVPSDVPHSSTTPEKRGTGGPDADVVLSHATSHEVPAEGEGNAGEPQDYGDQEEATRSKRKTLLAALTSTEILTTTLTMSDEEISRFVKTEFERLDEAYEEVNRFALQSEQETQTILEKLGEKRALLASTPTRVPTQGYITSHYDVRLSPYDGRRKVHEGIDIANRYGADIIAPADGLVQFSGSKPGYGKTIVIDHGNGIETRYAHSSKLFVNAGDKVRRGQKIAAIGNSGYSTGPHVHYEVRVNGMAIDPCWYILDRPDLCQRRR